MGSSVAQLAKRGSTIDQRHFAERLARAGNPELPGQATRVKFENLQTATQHQQHEVAGLTLTNHLDAGLHAITAQIRCKDFYLASIEIFKQEDMFDDLKNTIDKRLTASEQLEVR